MKQWCAFLCLLSSWAARGEDLPRLRVSENQRFLVTTEGKAFFYLGDTAWELFHRLNREEATRYLEDRARKGYTVVQAVGLAELDGLRSPNAYGHLPLENMDPRRPVEAYWQHVDFIVKKANELGLYVGFLPTWGDKWNQKWGKGPEIFSPENAEAFGLWLGKRYRDTGILWILGGDRPVETDRHREILRAMARGLRQGDGGAHLMTFHPTGGQGSAEVFHSEAWLDFNMRQNGHAAEYTGRYEKTLFDYGRSPTKPVLDGEPIYEGHPVNFRPAEQGYSIAADVRRAMYWDLFSGACGHTYGHHSVWQMWAEGREAINNPLSSWVTALEEQGAGQMQHGRRLIESRPMLTRVPDDALVVPAKVSNSVPGAGRYRFVGTRDSEGRYAMVYVPVGRAFRVDMRRLQGERVVAWWFDPRQGTVERIGMFVNDKKPREFLPPQPGEALDWVLVLDDAAQKYPPPGR